MGIDKINVQALEKVYPENLLGLEQDQTEGQETQKNKLALILSGTGLSTEVKDGETFIKTSDGESIPLKTLAMVGWRLRQLNTDDNKAELSLAELHPVLNQQPDIDPQAVMQNFQKLFDRFYNPLSQGLGRLKTIEAVSTLETQLKSYNQGLYQQEKFKAHEVGPLNSPTKFVLNIIPGVVLSPLNWILEKITGTPDAKVVDPLIEKRPASFFLADRWAQNQAYDNYQARNGAIEALKEVFDKGVANNEPWVAKMDLETILGKLPADQAQILRENLAVADHWKIATAKTDEERYQEIATFANGERNSFLMFGGGHAKAPGIFTLGKVNNYAFARASYNFLNSKARVPADPKKTDALHQEAKTVLDNMGGDGGGFLNLLGVTLTNPICGFGAWCEPTQYRPFSDEAAAAFSDHMFLGVTAFTGFVYRKPVLSALTNPEARFYWNFWFRYPYRGVSWTGSKTLKPLGGFLKRKTWDKWVKVEAGATDAAAAEEAGTPGKWDTAKKWSNRIFIDGFGGLASAKYSNDWMTEPAPLEAYDRELDMGAWPDPSQPAPELKKKYLPDQTK